ncbi:MAG: hypothetical protein WCS73_13185 [Lentisphaeria bacterium]
MMNMILNGKKIFVEKMEASDLAELGLSEKSLNIYSDSDIDIYRHCEQQDRFFISTGNNLDFETDIRGIEDYFKEF